MNQNIIGKNKMSKKLISSIACILFAFIILNLAIAEDSEKVAEIDAQQRLQTVHASSYPIKTIKIDQEDALLFPLADEKVAAAAFSKGGKVYLAFDREANFRVDSSNNKAVNYPEFVTDITQMEAPKGFSLLVIKLKSGFSSKKLVFNNQNGNWTLHTKLNDAKVKAPYRVRAMPMAAPFPRVEIIAEQNLDAKFYIKNKQLGRIMIIPFNQGGYSNNQEYKFTDFTILASIQGLAIEVGTDALNFSTQEKRLLIESSGGLNISKKLIKKNAPLQEKWLGTDEANSLLNLKYHISNSWQNFDTQLKELREKIYAELEDDQLDIYEKIARFYLANEFYTEAASIMRKLKESNPTMYNSSYKLLLAEVVANFMQKKYYDAFSLMNNIDIINSELKWRKELRFWQAITKAMVINQYPNGEKDNVTADLFLNSRANFLSAYPINIWFSIGLAVLREQTGLNSDKTLELIRFMAKFIQLSESKNDQNIKISQRLINRFYGQIANYYRETGKFDEAVDYYSRCEEDVTDLLNRSRCRFHLLQMQLENNDIKLEDAISQMHKLTTIWRGDEFEIEMQLYLADLHLKNKDNLNALNTWQNIIDNFPNTADALKLTGQISNLMTDMIFGNIKDEKLTPYQTASLFYRFQDYIPYGEVGDELIIYIANSLISLDLLEQAEKLLDHQVKNRLMGTRKEEVINLLAYLLLIDQKYDEIINVISWGDKYEHLSNHIAKKRKYIHAQALAALEREKEAIEMLDGDYSREADEILQGIFWKSQRWEDFNKVSEPYIYPLRNRPDVLNEAEARQIVKQAISYVMLDKMDLFNDLQQDIKPHMPEKSQHTEMLSQIQLLTTNCQDKSCNHGILDIKSLQNVVGNLAKTVK